MHFAITAPPVLVRHLVLSVFLASLLPWLIVRFYHWGAAGLADPPLWLAIAGVSRLLLALKPERMGPRMLVAAVAALFLAASPFQLGSAAALVLLGIGCYGIKQDAARYLGILLLGLGLLISADPLWRSLIAKGVLLFEAELLAFLVETLLRPAQAFGNVVALSDGRELLILRECSFLHLVGPAVLGGMSLAALIHARPAVSTQRLVAAIGVILLLNTARLLGMAWSDVWYQWLHDGPGVSLHAVLSIAIIMFIFVRNHDT